MEFFRRLGAIRAISFDLDDTLYDNRPVIEHAERWMVAHMRDRYLETAMFDRAWWQRLKLQFRRGAIPTQALYRPEATPFAPFALPTSDAPRASIVIPIARPG